jgi:hypothetical protein
MAFATTDNIADRLGRDLSAGEQQSVTLLIEGAQAVIAAACDKDDAWAEALDPVPKIVRTVAIELVCRAVANPNSLQSLQEGLGQHNYSARFRDCGILLTPHEELLVRRAVFGTSSGSSRPLSTIDELDILYHS